MGRAMSIRAGSTRTALVVGHFCPIPPTHGNRRRLLAFFAWLRTRGWRVVFVFQPTNIDDPSCLLELAKVVDRCIVTSPPSLSWSSFVAKLPVLWRLNRLSWGADDVERVCWTTTTAAVRDAVRLYDPLVVISEYAFFTRVFPSLPARVLKVVDTMEVFQRDAAERRRAGFPTEFSAKSETRALNRADVLIAIQKHDARALLAVAPTKCVVTVEHYSVDLLPRSPQVDTGVILYVASSNEYNRHGLAMFLAHAWQPILDAYPEATLHVIGSLTQDSVGAREAVVFEGMVADTRELGRRYASAHLVVNPQVSGTGLKIKSVEAISAGCAVVMNAAGADGIEEGIGRAFLVAADWKEFARHVLRILTDDAFRLELERGASLFAVQRFSADRVFREFAAVLEQHEASGGT